MKLYARLKRVSRCFRPVLAYFSLVWNVIRLHTHPPPLPLWVWHFSQSLLGILSSGVPPGSQNLDPISNQCCYNITCRVVTRMDICLVQCRLTLVNWNLLSAVWYLRSSNERRAFRQRPPRWTQISLVFSYLWTFHWQRWPKLSLHKVYLVKLLLKRFHLNRVTL